MIFTRSILSQILPLENISSDIICSTLNRIGLEVEGFKKIVCPKKVVVGKILSCQKHPDATKLNICEVAISDKNIKKQIVCGAKNAREGIFVAVALEGAILPKAEIKKAELRGVESCGMLCSTTELGFPEIYDGIMELDDSIGELSLGKELLEYPLFNDEVFEISITPNRGDCMNFLGIARDLAVALNLEIKSLKISESAGNISGIGRVLQITADKNHESSLMYKVIELQSIVMPLYVALLLAYNDSLKNNYLENILAFATLYSGVILNAYPQTLCHKIDKNETDTNTNKVVLNLKSDSLGFESIYCGETKLSTIGIAHQMEENFKNPDGGFIIIEASYIPPEIINEKILKTNIKTDAKIFHRTSRGSNPDLKVGLNVLENILSNSNAIFYTDAQEVTKTRSKPSITIELQTLAKIIGFELDKTEIINTLKALEFKVELSPNENLLIATPPLFRHDIARFQDIIEEIIRFIGFDNIPSTPLSFTQHNQNTNESRLYHFWRSLSKKAIGVGFNEVVHFVFNSKESLQKYGFETIDESLDILNPITQNLNTLRSTLLLGLLQTVIYNKNNGFNAISLVEVGSTFDKKRQEKHKIAFIQSGFVTEERYPNAKGVKGNFFSFADRISCVIGDCSLQAFESEISLFHPNQCSKVIKNGKHIGIIATLHPVVQEEFDLEETYLCELDLNLLEEKLPQVQKYSKFQKVIRDLSILSPKHIPYYSLQETIRQLDIKSILKFYPLDIYADETLKDLLSLTIRFEIQSKEKTLEEKEITEIMEKILENLKKTHGIALR
ncbi:MAG: phenylalanine--tRNA ligase subunit beta [Helicobacter sp.]|nr:phenylalanine--tRNA ligase subunit beta [Helicobacter sp.]